MYLYIYIYCIDMYIYIYNRPPATRTNSWFASQLDLLRGRRPKKRWKWKAMLGCHSGLLVFNKLKWLVISNATIHDSTRMFRRMLFANQVSGAPSLTHNYLSWSEQQIGCQLSFLKGWKYGKNVEETSAIAVWLSCRPLVYVAFKGS